MIKLTDLLKEGIDYYDVIFKPATYGKIKVTSKPIGVKAANEYRAIEKAARKLGLKGDNYKDYEVISVER